MAQAFPARLTSDQTRLSQRRYLIFAVLNAVSYATLAESVLILYALRFGAGDFHAGLIASYINLTMVFMVGGKLLVARWGAVRTYAVCWFSRNTAAALMLLAPAAAVYSPRAGLYSILAASALFFIFRAAGIAAHNVMINDITTEESRGRFIGVASAAVNLVTLGALLALSHWLKGEPAIIRFQAVIACGCLFGIASAIALSTIRESDVPRQSSREPLLWALTLIRSQKPMRRLLAAWLAATVGVQLLVPFQVLAVKRGYLLGADVVIRFVALQMLGSMMAAYLNSLLLDRVGPRPVLIINVLALTCASSLWVLSPEQVSFLYTDFVFFLAGFSSLSIQICLSHYFLNIVRKESVVNLSLVISMLEGAVVGVAGTFIGGGLLHVLPMLGLSGISVYKSYFAAVCVLQLLSVPVVMRLQPLADRRVKEVLGLMFSLRDWRALLSMQRLSMPTEAERTEKILDELAVLQSGLSEKTLLEYLDSPLFTIRTAALEALDKIDFGPQAAARLITEVERGEFTTAFMAAEILGRHRVAEAVNVLRKSLESEDFFLKGKAMLSLAQLRDEPSFEQICRIFADRDNPRLLIHGARALFHIGDRRSIDLLIRRLDTGLPGAVNDEIMHTIFSLFGWADDNFRLMTLYNRSTQLGIDELDAAVTREFTPLRLYHPEKRILPARLAVEELLNSADEPEHLVRLLDETVKLADESCCSIKRLLDGDAVIVRQAGPRLRFSLTALAAFLYLRRGLGGPEDEA